MIDVTTTVTDYLRSPVRKIDARVEFYLDSTLVTTCSCDDRLIKFTVERIGDTSKFFGFGICQKINVHLIDAERELNFTTAHDIKVAMRVDKADVNNRDVYPFPTFHITEVRRDENTNELSITAYDLMYPDSAHLIKDMELPESYSLLYFVAAASNTLSATGVTFADPYTNSFTQRLMREYPNGGNFEGTETVREGLNAVAEATQSIYYINNKDQLTYTQLVKDSKPDLRITKDDYIKLKSRTNRRLGKIVHATELGENLEAGQGAAGTTQYIRDNAFWTTLDPSEVAAELEQAIADMGNLTIGQFECNWRGNYLLEIGDKIELVTKDDDILTSYVLDDVIYYDGSFSEDSQWSYNDNDNETAENPSNLGDALNQTFAKVDKINKEITLYTSKVDELGEEVASLKLTTDDILIKVESVETNIETVVKETVDSVLEEELTVINDELGSLRVMSDAIYADVQSVQTTTDELGNELSEVKNRVNQTITSEELAITVQQTMASAEVGSVTTETGFTFNGEGLTIEKGGSEMKTVITEDGMAVYRDYSQVLTANHEGVYATNLYASTFLILGELCRFEGYQDNTRVGCFWIG